MNEISFSIFAGLEPAVAIGLFAASFLGSFITVALGIGGGAMLLAVMASLLPPVALIPVHGVIQFGSNITRAGVLIGHAHWPPVLAFGLGTLFGVTLGGLVVVNLPPWAVQIGVGFFVIWSVLKRPPAWLSRWPAITGAISSFLTMFFGATGVFVANFSKSLQLGRQGHVATHAVLMTIQHFLKVAAFAVLGFAFGPWLGFIVVMILTGFLGTLIGRGVLVRLNDGTFRRALDIALVLISLRLIWQGISVFDFPLLG